MVYEVLMKLPTAGWDIPPMYRGIYFDMRAEAEAHVAELVADGNDAADCTIARRDARPAARKLGVKIVRVAAERNALPVGDGKEIPLPELDVYFR